MRNVKFISIFAACGFILSFVFGLFSHSSFLFILLRAIIFSIVFVLLGMLVSFIFNKFLLDSNSLGFDSEDTGVVDMQQKSNSGNQKTGQVIDVVVEDEDLPASESDNHFVVGTNAQMLKKTDIGDTTQVKNKERDNSESKGFVPLKGFESVSKDLVQGVPSSSETAGEVAEIKPSAATIIDNVSDEDLDTLPDMENLNLTDEDSDDESDSYTDTEFVSSANMYKKSGSSGPDVKDAALIAKAISTALSEEN